VQIHICVAGAVTLSANRFLRPNSFLASKLYSRRKKEFNYTAQRCGGTKALGERPLISHPANASHCCSLLQTLYESVSQLQLSSRTFICLSSLILRVVAAAQRSGKE
jgi:hypothetical protein